MNDPTRLRSSADIRRSLLNRATSAASGSLMGDARPCSYRNGIAGYIAFGWRPRPRVTAAVAPASAAPASPPPPSLGEPAEPITLPPLDASDALVRMLVRVSRESGLTAWLTTDDLIRNFTIVVANIADGATPAKQLKVLRPSSAFSGRARWQSVRGSAKLRSICRIADAFASLDPVAAARLYATLKPRIEEAHRELGSADLSFDRTLSARSARS